MPEASHTPLFAGARHAHSGAFEHAGDTAMWVRDLAMCCRQATSASTLARHVWSTCRNVWGMSVLELRRTYKGSQESATGSTWEDPGPGLAVRDTCHLSLPLSDLQHPAGPRPVGTAERQERDACRSLHANLVLACCQCAQVSPQKTTSGMGWDGSSTFAQVRVECRERARDTLLRRIRPAVFRLPRRDTS